MRLTIREDNAQLEQTTLPQGLLLPWDTTLPGLQIENALRIAHRFCVETKWMVSSPGLSLLPEAHHAEGGHVGCFALREFGIASGGG